MSEKFFKLLQDLTSRKDLLPSDKIVFAVLLDYQGHNGYSWPGERTLAEKAGLTTVTIVACIRRLEAKRLLIVERRGNGKCSYYSITESGKETIPVKKLKRVRNLHGGGKETMPEAGKKLTPNQTDLLNQTTTTNSFAFVLRTKNFWHLPQAKLDEYKQAYPAIDVEDELRKAAQWLSDNPRKRKTAEGMYKFISGWLSRVRPARQNNKSRSFTQAEEAMFCDKFIAENVPTEEKAAAILAEVGMA